MINSVYDYVDGLNQILSNNLSSYLDNHEEDGYELDEPVIYLYEKKVFESYPDIVILADISEAISREVKSDVVGTDISLFLIVSGEETKLAKLSYLYEASVRECLYQNKEYNNISYVWLNSSFGMQINVGSQLLKQITMKYRAYKQETY